MVGTSETTTEVRDGNGAEKGYMDAGLLKTVGQVAGLAGLALGMVILIFRAVISRIDWPVPKQEHAYKLLRLLLVLVAVIALAGIAAWVVSITPPVDGEKDDVKVQPLSSVTIFEAGETGSMLPDTTDGPHTNQTETTTGSNQTENGTEPATPVLATQGGGSMPQTRCEKATKIALESALSGLGVEERSELCNNAPSIEITVVKRKVTKPEGLKATLPEASCQDWSGDVKCAG